MFLSVPVGDVLSGGSGGFRRVQEGSGGCACHEGVEKVRSAMDLTGWTGRW